MKSRDFPWLLQSESVHFNFPIYFLNSNYLYEIVKKQFRGLFPALPKKMARKWLVAMPKLQPQIFSFIWLGWSFYCPQMSDFLLNWSRKMAKKINLEYEEKNYSEKIEKLLFLSYLVVLLLKKIICKSLLKFNRVSIILWENFKLYCNILNNCVKC